jgi:hypothetical protein
MQIDLVDATTRKAKNKKLFASAERSPHVCTATRTFFTDLLEMPEDR